MNTPREKLRLQRVQLIRGLRDNWHRSTESYCLTRLARISPKSEKREGEWNM